MIIYNTLSGKKEEFKPREEGKISIYVCGPTVYNYIHIGNARAYIAFDAIIRYLKHKGYKVNYIRNLTDVDDKIIKRAAEEKKTAAEIAKKYTKPFKEDMEILGVEAPDVEPKATEHIGEMIEVVKKLIENGLAYEADGNVYFSVTDFKEYGKLSKRSLDDMIAGSRVEVDKRKKHPMDFALWKKARLPESGTGGQTKEDEVSWPSPWGSGRPGWHIECSVMANQYLGFGFDIHGGGQDLVFPHHENEIAQAEGAAGKKPFVRFWLHNGFLNIEKEKMAKSVGNVILIKDLESQYKDRLNDFRNDLRMLFLSTHYRSPVNFSDEKIRESGAAVLRINKSLDRISDVVENAKISSEEKPKDLEDMVDRAKKEFEATMDDDFNTAVALSVVFNLVKEVNTYLDKHKTIPKQTKEVLKEASKQIRNLTGILGFTMGLQTKVEGTIKLKGREMEIDDLLAQRELARKNKDFTKADSIRNALLKAGYEIEDTSFGPKIIKIEK